MNTKKIFLTCKDAEEFSIQLSYYLKSKKFDFKNFLL